MREAADFKARLLRALVSAMAVTVVAGVGVAIGIATVVPDSRSCTSRDDAQLSDLRTELAAVEERSGRQRESGYATRACDDSNGSATAGADFDADLDVSLIERLAASAEAEGWEIVTRAGRVGSPDAGRSNGVVICAEKDLGAHRTVLAVHDHGAPPYIEGRTPDSRGYYLEVVASPGEEVTCRRL